MPAGAVHADEIERTYGPLTCKALPALMEWLALRSDLDSLAGETHAITMMTIHSAKGLEFPAVFVAGMEEGIFPHVHDFGGSDDPGKLEEERRLAYVAITRARKRLFLTYAATRRTYGSTSANPRSRFLNEIPFEDIEFSGIGSAGFEGTAGRSAATVTAPLARAWVRICMAARCLARIRARPAVPVRAVDRALTISLAAAATGPSAIVGSRPTPAVLPRPLARARREPKSRRPRCPRRWSARSIAPAHRRTLPRAIP